MTQNNVDLGRWGEQRAADALCQRSFTIVTRNWYCAEGEVDIVAHRNDALYFFEVRTRRGTTFGTPELSVTPEKRVRMETVARRYIGMEVDALDVAWHLGLVAVQVDERRRVQRLTIYPDLDGGPLPPRPDDAGC
jgi:putative endonuclease